jgi:hypothetical protein
MENKGIQWPMVATGSAPKPGELPLGSAQSRAAARAKLEQRLAGRERMDWVFAPLVPTPGFTEPHLGEWTEGEDGSLWRSSHLPADMTIEEAERIVAQPEWKAVGHICGYCGKVIL